MALKFKLVVFPTAHSGMMYAATLMEPEPLSEAMAAPAITMAPNVSVSFVSFVSFALVITNSI